MTANGPTLILALQAAAVLAVCSQARTRPLLLWNATASAPVGLYRIGPERRPVAGDLVVVRPERRLGDWMVARGYVGRNVPLVKRVSALEGARICRFGLRVTLNGRAAATALRTDRLGRALPTWRGCHTLSVHEVFLLNAAPASLDGRYFGATPTASLVGRADALWLKTAP